MSMNEGQGATVTVGAALAEVLARAGVKIAFTVPGESLLGLLDGLAAHRVRIVAARHEGAASFMAEAVAQLTGRPTLVLAGRAPGAANLAIGLQAAQSDSAPVIAIVGQVRREVRGREAFQEMELVRTFESMVKWAAEAKEPGEVVALGERAVATAMRGRPGPVLLAVPEDLLDAVVPAANSNPAARVEHPAEPDPALVRKAMHLLLDAQRPLIVAGAGILRARTTDALVRFAETVQVPVVASWRRGDVFPNDNPLYLGMTGLGSPASVRARLEETDALLVLGCRMGEMTTYGYSIPGAGTRWAQVDVEPRGAMLAARPEIVMAADVAVFLRMAQRVLANAALDAPSFDARRAQNAADREAFEAASVVGEEPWDGPGVHPGRVVATLGRVLPGDAIVTTDAGDFGTWAARGLRFHRPGTFLGCTSGAMGFGLPAAIGATLARPGRLGVALAGDGGFAMTMAELETAVRERAHVIAIVFDNGRYGMIWRHQRQRGGPGGLATRLGAVNFAAIAEACGALGISVNSDEEFEPALRQAIEAGRPAVLHLALDPRWTTPDAMPSSDDAVAEPSFEAPSETDAVAEPRFEIPSEADAVAEPSFETPSEADAVAEPSFETPSEADAEAVPALDDPAEMRIEESIETPVEPSTE
jgi:acetolactate synthase-1/2/3 large subunit